MIVNEREYRDWIQKHGVGANDRVASSPDSYVSYLNAVSGLLGIDISATTLASEADVLALARRLEGKRSPATISNYKSAMRQYVAMAAGLSRNAPTPSSSVMAVTSTVSQTNYRDAQIGVELRVHAQHDSRASAEFAKVAAIAEQLLKATREPDCAARIIEANRPGKSSSEVQACFLPVAQALGFHSERQGLFSEYESGLRPDYYMPVGETGILLEVERGKTTANNMDMLDFWKCHLCSKASYLFLFVPRALQHNDGMRPVNPFVTVERRLKWFFQHPRNYTNVKALFLFGY